MAGRSGCDQRFFLSVFFCCSEKLFEAEAMLSDEWRPEATTSLTERTVCGLSSVKLDECLWPFDPLMTMLFALRLNADLPPTESELDRLMPSLVLCGDGAVTLCGGGGRFMCVESTRGVRGEFGAEVSRALSASA